MQRLFTAVFFITVFLVQSRATLALPPFGKALQAQYDFKSVSCLTCHYNRSKKTRRRPIGDHLAKQLEGKDIKKRMRQTAGLEADDPKKLALIDGLTKDFLAALKKVESMKSPSGVTYGELLQKGTLYGVKPKKTARENARNFRTM